MKQILLLILFIGLVSCGPSKNEKQEIDKLQKDSLKKDSIAAAYSKQHKEDNRLSDLLINVTGLTTNKTRYNISIDLSVTNNSTKVVRAYRGYVVFNSLFHEYLGKTKFEITTPIESGEKQSWEITCKFCNCYDEVLSEYKRNCIESSIIDKKITDLQISVTVEGIIFSDDERIGNTEGSY